jgi:HAD superfamily hydrolase (TIGR01490 family)
MEIGAFFDIDGTLYREGMITAIFKKLIKSEIISKEIWYKEVREKYRNWEKRVGNYDDYLLKIAEIYIDTIKGLHRTQIEFIAKKVIEQKGDKVYQYTRDRIKWHLEEGHKVFTISGSPIELVREMSAKYNVTDYFGSVYMTKDDIYTGEVEPMWDSKNKKLALEKLVNQYNIDLQNSYAYGDTAGDFDMLKLVGNPVAMNATKELLHLLREDKELVDNIKIIVERKDMIYHLGLDCLECKENMGF